MRPPPHLFVSVARSRHCPTLPSRAARQCENGWTHAPRDPQSLVLHCTGTAHGPLEFTTQLSINVVPPVMAHGRQIAALCTEENLIPSACWPTVPPPPSHKKTQKLHDRQTWNFLIQSENAPPFMSWTRNAQSKESLPEPREAREGEGRKGGGTQPSRLPMGFNARSRAHSATKALQQRPVVGRAGCKSDSFQDSQFTNVKKTR